MNSRSPSLCVMAVAGVLLACEDPGRRTLAPNPTSTAPPARPTLLVTTGDPVTGTWEAAPNFPPYVAIHASLLPTGQVLFWSGADGPGHGPHTFQFAFVGDPATGAWTEVSNRKTNVFCSGHSFLPDGRLLVSGGHSNGDGLGKADVNIFDPARNRWSTTADMAQPRWYPTNTTLPVGDVLTIGGSRTGLDASQQVKVPEVWSGGKWRRLTNVSLELPYYPWMFVAPNGKVYYAGPGEKTGYLSTDGAGAWNQTHETLRKSSSSAFSREYGSAVMYEPGKILIVGGGSWYWTGGYPIQNTNGSGGDALDGPSKSAETIDLNTGAGWQATGSMMYPRRHHNAIILPDGRVLVTGGTSAPGHNDGSGRVLAAEVWNPKTGAWTVWSDMRTPRMYHSVALLLPDGRILTAGGGLPPAGSDVDHPNADIFSPPYLFNANDGSLAARPVIGSAPTVLSYAAKFNLQVSTSSDTGVVKITLVRLGSVTHTFDQNQRFQILATYPAARGARTLEVPAPRDANVAPPGHYMLFVIDGGGVPSVAKIVQIR